MKKSAVIAILGFSIVGCDKMSTSGVVGELKTDEQKYSYALGQQVGKNLSALELPIDKKILTQSLISALEKKESKMDDKQIQEAMMMMRDARMAKMSEAGEKNKKTGEEFLAKNKEDKEVKVTESGLQYKVLTEGKGPKPAADDKVEVHYKGTLIDGTEFDSSYKRNAPATFGVKQVIPGWTEALQMMNEGSKWKLFIPSELAYKDMDRPNIPANSVLVFEVELLKVNKATAQNTKTSEKKK